MYKNWPYGDMGEVSEIWNRVQLPISNTKFDTIKPSALLKIGFK